ncbi:MAG TPA: SDR family oxidoreductase, partial [Steroidobacteraceae bacterium]|nr:SDR family oxidoreductase [Steroidobacteraceae bacterium]
MNRRQLLQAGLAAAAASAMPGLSLASERPLKLLILGGTGFIGPHFVETALARGHELTLFNRGKRNTELFPDVERILGDRNGEIDGLKGRRWDAVIDNSGYVPRHVQLSADLLHGNVGRYLFISSISVYASLAEPGIDEDAPLAQIPDPTVEEITGETYGALKALCEQAVERRYGSAATIVRPTYIVGPRDTTDRFTYWPVRVSQGGRMLAPGTARDPVQIIDVRDLAEFVIGAVERDVAGRYNACSPPGAITMGDVLETSRAVTGSDARFVWVSSEFLRDQGLLESTEIPIWAPPDGE